MAHRIALSLRDARLIHEVMYGPAEIVTLKNRTISPAAQLFIDSSREIAKQLVKRKDG